VEYILESIGPYNCVRKKHGSYCKKLTGGGSSLRAKTGKLHIF